MFELAGHQADHEQEQAPVPGPRGSEAADQGPVGGLQQQGLAVARGPGY